MELLGSAEHTLRNADLQGTRRIQPLVSNTTRTRYTITSLHLGQKKKHEESSAQCVHTTPTKCPFLLHYCLMLPSLQVVRKHNMYSMQNCQVNLLTLFCSPLEHCCTVAIKYMNSIYLCYKLLSTVEKSPSCISHSL